jgi:hypothetical protein
MHQLLFFFILPFIGSCNWPDEDSIHHNAVTGNHTSISAIPPPPGFHRIRQDSQSYAQWLQQLPLKKDRMVYLYDGSLKQNQSAQFAVVDVTVGKKNLQQCADAILRLKAEYLYQYNQHEKIRFKATDGTWLIFSQWLKGIRYKLVGKNLVAYQKEPPPQSTRQSLNDFLELVFLYCGTYSLYVETFTVDIMEMTVGDMFVKPGAPGHAMLVVDMAKNKQGEKVFLLAQSYMPAQNIHIVKNRSNNPGDPWYRLEDLQTIDTPEWTFRHDQLRRW